MNHALAPRQTLPAPGIYRLDLRRSALTFSSRALWGTQTVAGRFPLLGGIIRIADPVERSTVVASAGAAGFESGNEVRDAHVRSAAYLDTDRHPEIVFRSTAVTRGQDGWRLAGSLTVRGTTRDLDWTVTVLAGSHSGLAATATAVVDRYEFGITTGRGKTGRYQRLSLDVVGILDPPGGS